MTHIPKVPGADERAAELRNLIERARDWFNALSPEMQRKHREEQRRAWVRGEMMLEHPEMTKEQADALIDAAMREGK